ncbi:MAG: hypothetical protein O3A20_09590, partial [Planctomycetota bacterium]|nr:hypothetical protein [Planctomycetota bacterium]
MSLMLLAIVFGATPAPLMQDPPRPPRPQRGERRAERELPQEPAAVKPPAKDPPKSTVALESPWLAIVGGDVYTV